MDATETTSIHLERQLDCAPSALWRALTEPALVAQWWAPGDVQPVLGHVFEMDMGQWGQQRCEVVEVEPERRFAYRYAVGALDTTLTWTLEPRDGGTFLTMTHAGFDLEQPMQRMAFDGMGNGWPSVVERLGIVATTAA